MTFFLYATAPTEIYSLSLHDALPIFHLDWGAAPERLVDHAIALGELEKRVQLVLRRVGLDVEAQANRRKTDGDRKSTRLNSSHLGISYAVFCLKKKKTKKKKRVEHTT